MLHRQIRGQSHLLDRHKVVMARWAHHLYYHCGMTHTELWHHVEATLARRADRPMDPLFKREWSWRRIEKLIDAWTKYRDRISDMRLRVAPKLWIDGTERILSKRD